MYENISKIVQYKNTITRKYISISDNEIDPLPREKYWISKKYDGQLWFYCKSENSSKIINTSERDISDIVIDIKNELDQKSKKSKKLILAGELYSLENDRERYGDTISCLSNKSKVKQLRFGVFDIILSDKLLSTFEDKYNYLVKNIGIDNQQHAHVIEHVHMDQKDIKKIFKDKVEVNNAEGIIVRNDTSIYKVKNEETADFLVTGFTLDDKPNEIRSISLGVFLNEKEIVHVGSCGNISKNLNKDLYKKLTKIKTNSNFQKIASNGSAYNFVKPEVVCEIKLLDFQGDKSNDDPIRHLKFEYLNNSLNATGRARSISILNSTVINIRTDKDASFDDCGLEQLSKITGMNKNQFEELTIDEIPKSKLIKKEILKKESKKGIAIKKFMFWKTNKEQVAEYPSYLCYYLDYSEGRGDPIKRKMYPFEDEKLGAAYFENLVESNFKKGWEKYNGS